MKKNIYIILCIFNIVLLSACSPGVNNDTDEDYDKLFPFKGIDKPKISYDDQALQLASIDMNEQSYIYPGVDIKGEKRTYTITLTCTFFEKDLQGSLIPDEDLSSTYIIRYIDANKKLRTITSKDYSSEDDKEDEPEGSTDDDSDDSSEDNPEDNPEKNTEDTNIKILKNGKELKIIYQAISGFPMFLQVKGGGPSNSSVRANISAISNDGFTIVRPLHVEQFQNEEGINLIKNPFCGYIILP